MIARCFGVLGRPVAHSRSPILHAAAFEALGLPHRYLAFEVSPERLAAAVRGAAALGFGGLNLTVPHKQSGRALCDRVSDSAARIGAVNTLCFVAAPSGVEIVGHNTDAPGFLDALAELAGPPLRRATVLGAGGASLAIVHALLDAHPQLELTWVSRTPDRIPVPKAAADRVRPTAWERLGRPHGELLVNTTTVGLVGGPEEFPIALELDALDPGARVIDIVYPRPRAGLLDRAERAGLAVQDGLPMLHRQAVRALELWLGRALPDHAVAAMRQALDSTTS